MSEIKLKINGESYTGWKSLNLVRSIEALCGRFEVSVSDRSPFPIPRGGFVELFLYDNLIISGYTDSISSDINASEFSVDITGRDKTADLVDCSAMIESQEMLNVTLQEIIEQIVEPFGITAIFQESPAKKFTKFSFQQETAFEAIERACRLRGVFATSNEKGQIIIQSYGNTRAGNAVIMGENVLASRTLFNDADRFSQYNVFGQQAGDGNISPTASATPNGAATDLGVGRYRPMILIAEGNVDDGTAQDRAEWEATVRAARAVSVDIVVHGWLDNGGNLWRENQLVKTILPQQNIESDMLIKEVSFSLDGINGEKTRLSLVRPDAYLKQPDLKEESLSDE